MKLSSLSHSLVAGEIALVELLHIPYDIKTRTRIDVELLEKMSATAQSKCTFVLLRQVSAELQSILLTGLELEPASKVPDLRWGVRFLDSRNVIMYAIYLDGRSITGTGSHGLIDEKVFNVRGRLVSWLESSLVTHCPTIPL